MKTKSIIISVLCAVALVACETWEPDSPGEDYSLREQIEGQWFAQAYISPYGKEIRIAPCNAHTPKPMMRFRLGANDTCYISWICDVNIWGLPSIIDDKNHITTLHGGRITMEHAHCWSEKFFRVMQSVNAGYVRNDSLFLLTDPKKNHQYEAICLTKSMD